MCHHRPPTCLRNPRRQIARGPPRPSCPDCSPWLEGWAFGAPQAAIGRAGFPLSGSKRVSAIPASQIPPATARPKKAATKRHRRVRIQGFGKRGHRQAGNATPEVCHQQGLSKPQCPQGACARRWPGKANPRCEVGVVRCLSSGMCSTRCSPALRSCFSMAFTVIESQPGFASGCS